MGFGLEQQQLMHAIVMVHKMQRMALSTWGSTSISAIHQEQDRDEPAPDDPIDHQPTQAAAQAAPSIDKPPIDMDFSQ